MPKTLAEYRQSVERTHCPVCGASIAGIEKIDHYTHDGGWTVEGFEGKQWLSIHCPACVFDIGLNKLGVSRS